MARAAARSRSSSDPGGATGGWVEGVSKPGVAGELPKLAVEGYELAIIETLLVSDMDTEGRFRECAAGRGARRARMAGARIAPPRVFFHPD